MAAWQLSNSTSVLMTAMKSTKDLRTKNSDLTDDTPRRLVHTYGRFDRACCLRLQTIPALPQSLLYVSKYMLLYDLNENPKASIFLNCCILRLEAASSSEMQVTIYQSMPHCYQETWIFNTKSQTPCKMRSTYLYVQRIGTKLSILKDQTVTESPINYAQHYVQNNRNK